VNNAPGLSQDEVDEDAILLRAYGKGTQVLIDRESAFNVMPPLRYLPTLTRAQKRHDLTPSWLANASRPRSTPGSRMVFCTSTLRAVHARLPTCAGPMYGGEWLRGWENGMQRYLYPLSAAYVLRPLNCHPTTSVLHW
jgi:hypothetical protein